jgi:hypothetical protein
MGWLALLLAIAAGVSAVLPYPGMFVGMGGGVLAMGLGVVGYHRRQAPSGARLAGAGAITVGLIALLLCALRYALTLSALSRLEDVMY